MTIKDKKLSIEFNEFLSAPEISPPEKLSHAILSQVHQELNPTSQSVFIKVLGIHAVVSLFSLSICSQFGVKVLPLYDAMESMMSLVGKTYCMALCGLLYLGLSAMALSFLLKPEEVKVIRRHKILQLTLLTGISLGVFLCLGAKILFIPAALWIAGSLIGGMVTLELGWLLRAQFRKQLIFGS